jgi:hypothetical protein
MNENQIDQLLQELVSTRKSFDAATASFNAATRQIRWNRINTTIQYVLIFVVAVMFCFGVVYYLDQQRESCERGNALRTSIKDSLDSNAIAIGVALAVVSDAPEGKFQEYLNEYGKQEKPEALKLRNC